MSNRTSFRRNFSQEIKDELFRLRKRLVVLCTKEVVSDTNFIRLSEQLEDLEDDTPVDTRLPYGKFYVIGPSKAGLCFVYKPTLASHNNEGEVTVHRYEDLVMAGIQPKWAIAEVQR